MKHKVPATYDVTTSVHSFNYCVKWEADGARFHVWMNGPADLGGQWNYEKGVVFKNPPRGTERRSDDWFDTRRMNIEANAWVDVRAWLLSLPEGDFEAAQSAARMKEDAESEKRAQEVKTRDMKDLAKLLDRHFPSISVSVLEAMTDKRVTA